jgi:hypothetical protein
VEQETLQVNLLLAVTAHLPWHIKVLTVVMEIVPLVVVVEGQVVQVVLPALVLLVLVVLGNHQLFLAPQYFMLVEVALDKETHPQLALEVLVLEVMAEQKLAVPQHREQLILGLEVVVVLKILALLSLVHLAVQASLSLNPTRKLLQELQLLAAQKSLLAATNTMSLLQ